MDRRRWLGIWSGVAILALVAGAASAAWYRLNGRAVPVWAPGIVMYGAVFLVFLWLDRFGRSATRHRAANDARPVHPRPRPAPKTSTAVSRQAAVQETDMDAVRLVRVRPDEAKVLHAMRVAERTEVLALDGLRLEPPPEDTGGAAREWLGTPGRHAFFIDAQGEHVGCAVVRAVEDGGGWYRVESFYVAPAWRRRRIGRHALRQLAEFCRLAGGTGLAFHLSVNNGRARRFVAGLGFTLARPAALPQTQAWAGVPGEDEEVWVLSW